MNVHCSDCGEPMRHEVYGQFICQECCDHDEQDHWICMDCGKELDPGADIDAAMDYYEGDR